MDVQVGDAFLRESSHNTKILILILILGKSFHNTQLSCISEITTYLWLSAGFGVCGGCKRWLSSGGGEERAGR